MKTSRTLLILILAALATAGCEVATEMAKHSIGNLSGCELAAGVSGCRSMAMTCHGQYGEWTTEKGQIECSCCDQPERP